MLHRFSRRLIHLQDATVYADILYGSGLRDGVANTDELPGYYPVNVGVIRPGLLGSGEVKRGRFTYIISKYFGGSHST